jgi:hypothetical protein
LPLSPCRRRRRRRNEQPDRANRAAEEIENVLDCVTKLTLAKFIHHPDSDKIDHGASTAEHAYYARSLAALDQEVLLTESRRKRK